MVYNNPEYESNNFKLLSKYSYEEMIYHINQCEKSDLIEVGISPEEYTTISDLTPKGHKYISDIRSDNVWSKTKSIANKIGAKSLDAMVQISSNVISEIIKHEFGYL
uniref:YjcQ protein n=1 Tax=Firmicutes phage HS16 TaxID=3056394 RepID=A0AA49X479_9VIRU|nr:MAG: YjcQ protein [Firmicutes phage HS16]